MWDSGSAVSGTACQVFWSVWSDIASCNNRVAWGSSWRTRSLKSTTIHQHKASHDRDFIAFTIWSCWAFVCVIVQWNNRWIKELAMQYSILIQTQTLLNTFLAPLVLLCGEEMLEYSCIHRTPVVTPDLDCLTYIINFCFYFYPQPIFILHPI